MQMPHSTSMVWASSLRQGVFSFRRDHAQVRFAARAVWFQVGTSTALDLAHALHAECLLAWHYAQLTPHQRGLVDKRRGARYAKSLRMLALTEHDHCYGGSCEQCASGDASPAPVL